MAGGRGSRLKMGEKPLVTLFGKSLIDYVTMALEDCSVERIFVATTENVPKTRIWVKKRGLEAIDTPGKGFVADMIFAIKSTAIRKPILIIMSDLPLVTPDIIDEVIGVYEERPEPALSTHTPLRLHSRLGRRPDSLFNYQGKLIVPSGINILDGADIENEQEDYHLIMERIELAVNVNLTEDLMLCEKIINGDII
jgi:adenosylcobinamide-phosphate guanylyltransferase